MKYLWVPVFAFCVLLAGMASYGVATLMMDKSARAPIARALPVKAFAHSETLVPHKAVYKIDMVQKSSSAQVSNIGGQMYFEWKPACDAWTTKHRFNLVYDYADTPQSRIVSDFTTYESKAGDSFDFSSRRRRDGEDDESLRGHAAIAHPGQAGKAVYSVPEDTSFDLPAGTLFPMAHTFAVLDAAKKGRKFFNATVFDGSDEDGPVEVNAFIGPAFTEATMTATGIDPTLLASPAHRIRMAFFPIGNDNADSDYEMDIVLHENGVISDMRVDYREFSVTQKLAGLQKVKGEDCNRSAP